MTTSGAHPAGEPAWTHPSRPDTPTVGWFLRRSALWAGIVVAAVASACALYAIASSFDSGDVHAAPQQDARPLKV